MPARSRGISPRPAGRAQIGPPGAAGNWRGRAAASLAALAGGLPLLPAATTPPSERPPAPAPAPAAPPIYDPFDPKAGLPPVRPATPPAAPAPSPAPAAPSAQRTVTRLAPPLWPGGAQVRITVALKTFPNGTGRDTYYRPYVAIWAEDANRALVRTIVVLGRDSSYHRHLTSWWRASGLYTESAYSAVTRATRPAGEHHYVWDGYNDNGYPLPKGRYTLHVEICRENGRRTLQSIPLEIGDAPVSLALPADVESNAGKIEYGPPLAPSPAPPVAAAPTALTAPAAK